MTKPTAYRFPLMGPATAVWTDWLVVSEADNTADQRRGYLFAGNNV